MKIALITIQYSNNYGAMLQTFATKYILDKYGKVETINYDNKHLASHLDLIRFKFSVRGLKMLVHDLIRFPFRLIAVGRFKSFMKEYFQLTKKYSSEDLKKIPDYDVYVCGSDQIWNPLIVSADKQIDQNYFLSFSAKNKKKISYASSIGHHDYTNKEQPIVKNLLSDFNSISVRELDGVEKLNKIIHDKNISHVLDPTLLLSKKEWENSLGIVPAKQEEKYILVYSVPRTELIKKTIKYFSKKLNMKVIALDQMLFPLTKVDKHIKTAGPKEYAELFLNASFIITDSFHGTCFSINFNKPFVSVSPGKVSNRIYSLFDILDIKNRMVTSEDEFDSISTYPESNEVDEKLIEKRNESLGYLENAINN